MSAVHVCRGSDMHPYNCDGPGKCWHCDGKRFKGHAPRRCWLCWDGDPAGLPGPLCRAPVAVKVRERAIRREGRKALVALQRLPDIPLQAEALRAVIRTLDLGYLFGVPPTQEERT